MWQLKEAIGIHRLVVLADLVVLRHVGVEVVLPVENARLDGAVERGPDTDRVFDGHFVEYRQRTGKTETHRADVRVGLIAKHVGARAEDLRLRHELAMNFEPDYELPAFLNSHIDVPSL